MITDEVLCYYTQFAKEYDTTVLRDGDYIAFDKITRWILDLLPKNPCEILDLGCGTGLSSKPFLDAGHAVTGIDLTPAMLDEARALPFTKLICQSLDVPLKVPPAHFDAAVLLGVMEFVQQPESLFLNVNKALKTDGRFGLTLPKKLPESVAKKLGIRSYAIEDAVALFEKSGFLVKKIEEFQGFESESETVRYFGVLLQKR